MPSLPRMIAAMRAFFTEWAAASATHTALLAGSVEQAIVPSRFSCTSLAQSGTSALISLMKSIALPVSSA
jgi:hypothetical protein